MPPPGAVSESAPQAGPSEDETPSSDKGANASAAPPKVKLLFWTKAPLQVRIFQYI